MNVIANLAENVVVDNLQLNKQRILQNSAVEKLKANEQSLKASVQELKLNNAELCIRNSALEEDMSKENDVPSTI